MTSLETTRIVILITMVAQVINIMLSVRLAKSVEDGFKAIITPITFIVILGALFMLLS